MRKKLTGVIIVVSIVIVIFVIASAAPSDKDTRELIYHARLADPKLYQNGVFTDMVSVKSGTYEFRFVPNGDSPDILSITLKGPTFSFVEEFKLQGTEQGNVAKYYTWRYVGTDTIVIPDDQDLQIIINPHGNVLGPVSVYLVK